MTKIEAIVKQCMLNDSVETMVGMINQWEDDRCALESELVYDLKDLKDFNCIANMYGLSTAVDCYNNGQYVLAGCNFEKPASVNNIKADIFEPIFYDIAHSVCKYPTAYMRYVDIDALVSGLADYLSILDDEEI